MKSLVLLLSLAQLWSCHLVTAVPLLGYREPNCDDPEAEQVALLAVDHINNHLQQGYKHILNRIDKVKVWPRRPTGEVYELEIDTLETTCHALDPTPLANCSVRQVTQHAVEGDCDFHVLKQDGQFTVLSAKCDSTPDSAEDILKLCPDCPLLTPLNDTRVAQAAEAALTAFNEKNNGAYLQLVEIARAQLVPLPASTYVEFTVAATDCVAKEVTDPAKCNLLADKQYGFCKATVAEKVAREEVEVTCTIFPAQPVVPQPQPDVAGAAAVEPAPAVDPASPVSPPDGQSPSSLVVGPVLVAQAPAPPRAHYDLRQTFAGVPSMESGSGEAFHPGKVPVVVQPSVGAAPGPVITPCPGKVRYFKI
nr:alpha-2-HS-glycoprotein [Oryctolagus cuniculus]